MFATDLEVAQCGNKLANQEARETWILGVACQVYKPVLKRFVVQRMLIAATNTDKTCEKTVLDALYPKVQKLETPINPFMSPIIRLYYVVWSGMQV